ncbi:MAG: error-prone DNA polymerase [Myxococcota bacterium]|nr:error-prone DNA polymerase [Myxococcota bacterium]
MSGLPAYAPLWVKSNFSFLEGASHPEELVEEAHRLGLSALALTDRDGVYGAVRAHLKAKELGLKLLVGAQVSVKDGSRIVLLAQSRAGYGNLCSLLTVGRRRCPKGSSEVTWREVCLHAEGLVALWGGDKSLIASDLACDRAVFELKEAFGRRLNVLLARHRRDLEEPQERWVAERAARFELPLLAGSEVLYHRVSRRPLQDVLTCIRHGCTLVTAGERLRSNAEHELKSPAGFSLLFADAPAMVARTLEIADSCSFALDDIVYRYPSERLPSGLSSLQWLRQLTFEGAAARYGGTVPADVETQLNTELSLIDELDYPGYFLTMWEIVQFCRTHGILCQGRGSAANSAVCYCLGVTAIDPVRMGLLFERFISRERAEPPDIDLDIEHERREEVIQHVYEKYGRDRAAMVAVHIRYRPKSAVRDVGKVLGLPDETLDRLARLLSRYSGIPGEVLERAGLDLGAPAHARLLELSSELLDFPRHLSIHPGGFLLGHEPVPTLVPVENGAMEQRTVIQWDKDDVENLGLFKVDLLALGALTQLHLCFDLLREHRGIELSMATIPADDTATFDMIGRGETVGVFQIESRAQMAMLPRLRPRCFYDLVIEVSIVRPGPITGGMVHPYLRRRNGEEEVTYPHPLLRPVLERQVMRLAVVAADYTPGEADQLRRDMAAWKQAGRIERHRTRLIERMCKKGIELEFANRVFEQIRGFGEYGFPESHAASFALISYATAYLRCHYPAEFCCGLLNAQPMGFYTPATIVEDARRLRVEVRPVDVQRSEWHCTLECAAEPNEARPLALRMGLRTVSGLGNGDFELIAQARKTAPFASLADLARRTRIDAGALQRLSESGALECFGLSRRKALWDSRAAARDRGDALVLERSQVDIALSPLSEFETIAWDYAASSHSTRGHPMGPLRRELQTLGLRSAEQLRRLPDKAFARSAGIVICRQRPSTASGVTFMTLEDETGFINLVLWKDVAGKYELLVKTASLLAVEGQVQNKDGVLHMIARKLFVPKLELRPPQVGSRDFH